MAELASRSFVLSFIGLLKWRSNRVAIGPRRAYPEDLVSIIFSGVELLRAVDQHSAADVQELRGFDLVPVEALEPTPILLRARATR